MPADTTGRDMAMASLFDYGLTLVEVGERYGLSRERVRQCIRPYARRVGMQPWARHAAAVAAGEAPPPAPPLHTRGTWGYTPMRVQAALGRSRGTVQP